MGYYTSFYLQVHAMMAESRFKENGLAAANSDSREAFYQNFLAIIEQHEQKFANFMTLLQNHLEFPEHSAELACNWLVSCGLLESNNFKLKWNAAFLKSQDKGIKKVYHLAFLQQLENCPSELEPYKDILLKIYVNYATCLQHDYAQERGELIDSTIERMSTHLMRGVESTVAFGGWVVNQAIGCGLKFAKSAIKDVTDVSLVEADDSESLYELSNLAVELAEGTFEFAYHEKFKQFMERNKAEYYCQQQQYVDKQNKLYHFLFRAMVSNIKNIISLLIIHSKTKLLKSHQQAKEVINVLKVTDDILEKSVINKVYNYQRIINVLKEIGFDGADDEYTEKLKSMLKQGVDEFVKLKREESKMLEDVVEKVDFEKVKGFFYNNDEAKITDLIANGKLNPGEFAGVLCIKGFFGVANNVLDIFRINANARLEAQRGAIKLGLEAITRITELGDSALKLAIRREELIEKMAKVQQGFADVINKCADHIKELSDRYEQRKSRRLEYNEQITIARARRDQDLSALVDAKNTLVKKQTELEAKIKELEEKIESFYAKGSPTKSEEKGNDFIMKLLDKKNVELDSLCDKIKDVESEEKRIRDVYYEEARQEHEQLKRDKEDDKEIYLSTKKTIERTIALQCDVIRDISHNMADIMSANKMDKDYLIKCNEAIKETLMFALETVRTVGKSATKSEQAIFDSAQKKLDTEKLAADSSSKPASSGSSDEKQATPALADQRDEVSDLSKPSADGVASHAEPSSQPASSGSSDEKKTTSVLPDQRDEVSDSKESSADGVASQAESSSGRQSQVSLREGSAMYAVSAPKLISVAPAPSSSSSIPSAQPPTGP